MRVKIGSMGCYGVFWGENLKTLEIKGIMEKEDSQFFKITQFLLFYLSLGKIKFFKRLIIPSTLQNSAKIICIPKKAKRAENYALVSPVFSSPSH